ncbi:MAG: L-threonylcarbamoyladenylate synthase [Lentisphaeria bacterium]|jgi:L-threonylcarbamoyladenylate synthase
MRANFWFYNHRILQCHKTLTAGGVVAYPTEAVWGLGCDPFNPNALEKVLRLKNRDPEKGLILVAASIDQFKFLLNDVDRALIEQLKNSWPGHNTWLVEHKHRVPELVHGRHSTVALRVSTHPIIQALCTRFNAPIVSTSANPQGMSPAKTNFMVRRYFSKQPVFFAPGVTLGLQKPSAIRDLKSGKLVRTS